MSGLSGEWSSIGMFSVVLAVTLLITGWAARRTTTTADFYTANRSLSGLQNGLAITGDYISAGTFLGMTGLLYDNGFDATLYLVGAVVAWPMLLLLIAEPLRNLGKYSFADVCAFRLDRVAMRIFASCGSLVVVIFYLIGQIVAAGALIQSLFGMPYDYAVILVGVLMIVYVGAGGMIATSWVQIIKAVLLLCSGTAISFLVLLKFDFSVDRLLGASVAASPHGAGILSSGMLLKSPTEILTLAITLCFGVMGLPHILMRFFTVPTVKAARQSAFWATGFIGYFFLLAFIIGYGAIALLPMGDPAFFAPDGKLLGGNNLAAVHLAHRVGGSALMGFVSAVAFATIVAVVAGLTLSAAATIAHDLYGEVLQRGAANEKRILLLSRLTALAIGAIAIALGLLFKGQNIASIVTTALSIAASVNFPVLLLAIYWERLTTRGAFCGGMIGLVSAVVCAVTGPKVWVDVLHHPQPIFPLGYPTLVVMPLTFFLCWMLSSTDSAGKAAVHRAAFGAQTLRAQTGIGAEGSPERRS